MISWRRALRLLIAFLSTILFASATVEASEKELTVAFGFNRPPFVYQDTKGEWQGFEIELFKQALPAYKVVRKEHISNRALEAALIRGFDAAVTVQKVDDKAFYSDYFVAYENFAISRASDNLNIESFADLKGLSVVAWENAHKNLGPVFQGLFAGAMKSKQYAEFKDQRKQSKFFWMKRSQVILVDKTIFLWYKNELKKELNTEDEVRFHKIFASDTKYFVKFKRKAVRDDFNSGLKKLRESGDYQKIVESYLSR